MKIHYPNQWYVEMFDEARERWWPFLDSVGNKSYATGFFNALDTFIPHPPYRLIDNKGELYEVCRARKPVNVNANEAKA